MYTAITIAWTASAVGLILLILLHSPKGDGLAGFSGQAQLFASTRSAETALNRATWVLTVLFMVLGIVLSAGWLPAPLSTSAPAPTLTAPVPAASPVAPEVPPSLPATPEQPASDAQ